MNILGQPTDYFSGDRRVLWVRFHEKKIVTQLYLCEEVIVHLAWSAFCLLLFSALLTAKLKLIVCFFPAVLKTHSRKFSEDSKKIQNLWLDFLFELLKIPEIFCVWKQFRRIFVDRDFFSLNMTLASFHSLRCSFSFLVLQRGTSQSCTLLESGYWVFPPSSG